MEAHCSWFWRVTAAGYSGLLQLVMEGYCSCLWRISADGYSGLHQLVMEVYCIGCWLVIVAGCRIVELLQQIITCYCRSRQDIKVLFLASFSFFNSEKLIPIFLVPLTS